MPDEPGVERGEGVPGGGARGLVAVTGAGGFIGEALCRRLRGDGFSVLGVDADASRAGRVEAAGASFEAADVTDAGAMRAVLRDADLVVHTAARVSEWGPMDDFVRVNVGGTRAVLDAADAAGATRVVCLSSVAIWGYAFREDVSEDHPPRPCGIPYIDTKGAAERLARHRGATIVRPGDVYGPGSIPWAVRPLELVRTGRMRLPLGGRGLMTPVYIDDLVDCVVRALTHPEAAGHAFTAWDGEPVTTADFFGHYARMLGRKPVPTAPAPLLRAVGAAAEAVARVRGRPPQFGRAGVTFLSRRAVYPNARARELLGWEPRVGLEEGMRRTEVWFRAEGLL